jgi:hypothetical protein
MRSTGLKDRAGNAVLEGDTIVTTLRRRMPVDFLGVVRFIDDHWELEPLDAFSKAYKHVMLPRGLGEPKEVVARDSR